MPASADRRVAAALSYGVQMLGAGVLILSGMQAPVLIAVGTPLFGFGIGNATSLPPLIAQSEFARADSGRVVALIVAMAQAAYAFAPASFGVVRELGGVTEVLLLATAAQALAVLAFLAGRRRAL